LRRERPPGLDRPGARHGALLAARWPQTTLSTACSRGPQPTQADGKRTAQEDHVSVREYLALVETAMGQVFDRLSVFCE
jgi:hypothetical protein